MPTTFSGSRALADELNLPSILHVNETRLQVITAQEFYGQSMIEHLANLGFLAPMTSLIHCVWMTPKDLDLIAGSNATIQCNPHSNAVLGAGVPDFQAFKAAGINISMGSDGCGIVQLFHEFYGQVWCMSAKSSRRGL